MSAERARHRRVWPWALAVLAIAPPLWGFAIEPGLLRTSEHALSLPGWPATCPPLRIAVLADLHVGSPFKGLDALASTVERTRAARPDLILLAGDYVIHGVPGGTFTEPEPIAAALGALSAPLGVYAVLGNHDWWYDAARVRAALESAHVPVLENTATRLGAGECGLWLVGIGDFWEGRHDVAAALSGVDDDRPVLALTHNPDVFPEIPPRVALTIAGHTHGGQVYLPGIGRPVVPSRYGQRYAIGHVVEGDRHLFVSPGVGTSILPVRFLVPPEITVVTLSTSVAAPRAP